MTITDPRTATILDIVARETGVDRVLLVPGVLISELDIPSLDLVQTIFALEEHYKVDIPVVAERTGAEFQTVGDLVAHVLATLDNTNAGDDSKCEAEASLSDKTELKSAAPGQPHLNAG